MPDTIERAGQPEGYHVVGDHLDISLEVPRYVEVGEYLILNHDGSPALCWAEDEHRAADYAIQAGWNPKEIRPVLIL